MKITCQACQAKYTIADEKVVGKVVKIRCKKCGATIVVNGSEGASASQPPASTATFDYAGAAQEPWTVNVNDGDQRTLHDAEVVALYRSGIVTDETFCWKEGMGDWLPLSDIPPLKAACAAGPGAAASLAAAGHDAAASKDASPAALGRVSRPPVLPAGTAKDGNGAAAGVAARRAGGRAADNDLFSAAAKAGGEDEVLTSAPAGEKLTGARNESSVLFALNPLGDKAAPAAAPTKIPATNEASGLIDIRQLSAQMRSPAPEDKKKGSRVDDIMNLGGGGAFAPTLAAPVLSAPSLEHISTPPPPSMTPGVGGARNRALIFLAIGAGMFFLMASALLVVVLFKGKGLLGDDRERPMVSAAGTEATTAPNASAPASGSKSAAAGPTPSATDTASAAAPSESASAGTKEAPPAKEPPAPKEPAAAGPPKPAAAAAPAAPPAAAAAEGFNMGEAKARLGAIAGAVQSCKRGDATGSGRVEITFAPSGGVQAANLMPGSPFDGSLTAKCVEARFRGARIPAFSGSPMTVTKSFSIN